MKINKKQLIGVSPNSNLLKQYKKTLEKLSKIQWEAAIGLMFKHYSTVSNSESIEENKKITNKRLTKLERANFVLSDELKFILVGLLLGDLCAQKRSIKGNTNLHFEQGYLHKDYIYHLYDILKTIVILNLKQLIVCLISVQIKYIHVYSLSLILYRASMNYITCFILMVARLYL
jgi:hypothetical protein